MARLSELIPGYAEALKIPIGTVRNVAAVLRAGKLLTTGPRGPGAPHMTPTDATNLLLAIMYDDEQEAAPANIARLRQAELTSFRGRQGLDYGGADVTHLPPHDFVGEEGTAYSLGDVIDTMFDCLVRYGTLDADPVGGRPTDEWPYVSNISISISRPGHAARVWIDAVSTHWTLAYTWRNPEYEERRAADIAAGRMPSHALAHLGTFMSRTRSIQDEELAALADVLRGRSLDDADDGLVITPPYASGEHGS